MMKKIFLTMMVAVAMVGAANAIATWSFSGVSNPDYGYAYIFEAGVSDYIDGNFQSYNESGDTKYYGSAMVAIRDEKLDGGEFNGGLGSGTYDDFSDGCSYGIVFLDNSTEPTMYMVSDWMEYEGSTMSFDMSGAEWTSLSTVPEPASGMLLLIGMAGIALRRRRTNRL